MRANGIDISHWAPEFNYIPGSIDFIVHRVAHGVTEDSKLAQHAEASKDVKVRDGYLFYEMTSPWTAQGELAIELAKQHGLDVIWIDAETWSDVNVISDRFLNETVVLWDMVNQEFPGSGIYCNRDVLYHLVFKFGLEYMSKIPLWIADPRHDGEKIDQWIAGEGEPRLYVWYGGVKTDLGDNWFYWQTSFLGDPDRYGVEEKKAVDEDVFNGTIEELLEVRGKKPPEPPIPPEPEKPVCKLIAQLIELLERLKEQLCG